MSVVVDLSSLATIPLPTPDDVHRLSDMSSSAVDRGGAIWSLPHGGDLDANLVWLPPGGDIGEHVNGEVDVLLICQTGTATLTVDSDAFEMAASVVALIPKGSRRAVVAGHAGVTYLTVHVRRGPITIGRK